MRFGKIEKTSLVFIVHVSISIFTLILFILSEAGERKFWPNCIHILLILDFLQRSSLSVMQYITKEAIHLNSCQ